VDDLWDQFEGHYTALSCLDAVLMAHFSKTNTCPYRVDASPWFLRELMHEAYDRSIYLSADPLMFPRPPLTYASSVGTVEVYCDTNVPRERVFEFRCKCGTRDCLLKELGLD
jgi:hypothetical protein